METAWDLYRKLGPEALWNRSCGFLDLSIQETMDIQHNLLEEQLELMNRSGLGRMLFRGAEPRNADELRNQVRLTTYEDYLSTLGERREDVLPEPSMMWVRTSGRSGQYSHKWAPHSERSYYESGWPGVGLLLLSAAERRGDVRLRGNERYLDLLAPPPFVSGAASRILDSVWPLRHFPPPTPDSDAMPFDQRMALAFSTAVREGVDFTISIASVLAGLGETFHQRRRKPTLGTVVKQPRLTLRMARAALKARSAGRPILPKDVWQLRGLATSGMDSSLFRERIRQYWGRYPLEFFASTEGMLVATQAWDYTTLTFIPTLNFFEFIPEDELGREEQEEGYQPSTRFLDELEAGKNYEMVLTNLHGRPFTRYRTGDLIRITSMRNDRTGINLPQMAYYSRRSDVIDIAGFTRLTEKVIWQAIEEAGISYEDWTARKETDEDTPILHLRLEPRAGNVFTESEAEQRIHRALRELDQDWAHLEEMAGLRPLRVTYLPDGAFARYTERKRAQGAELAHLKPVHVNATDPVIEALHDTTPTEDLVTG